METLPIGRRVAYWRQRRKMSQQVFADRIGKSKSWVDKVERGARRLDKFSVLYEIAEVLQVDVQLMLGNFPKRRPESVNCIDEVEVEEIRLALERYDKIGSLFEPTPAEPPSLDELDKAVKHAWMTFHHAKYGVLARILPSLIRDAQAADAAYQTSDDRRAASLLAQAYQIAASALRKLGEYDLCWLAADRAIAVAQRAENPLLAGVATYRVANALLALGRPGPAQNLNVTVAEKIRGNGDPETPERLSVYGILLLQGAMAAAHSGDAPAVRELIDNASDAAHALGVDANHYWTSFGPTNVLVHKAAAAVELGDGHVAVQTHERELTQDALNGLTPERRANHFVDVSRGYTQMGNLDSAGEMLLEADCLAPSEVRCRPVAYEVLTEVLRRARTSPSGPLVELADHMGVAV
ncbi:MAG: helix-turn-helix domain-containing protein [Micromonosporaceae bacterium]|nr:helix-turn-helix domain-containing protein [Micromonosporaceae bacterium]